MKPLPRLALLVTYAILFLAAAGRSSVQLTTKAAEAPLPYSLSAAAALIYGVIAFALWRATPTWRTVALVGTAVELVGVLAVGTWGIVEPHIWPDETVWSGYGSGYGWIPLILPPLALWTLLKARRATGANGVSAVDELKAVAEEVAGMTREVVGNATRDEMMAAEGEAEVIDAKAKLAGRRGKGAPKR
jgi:uncharacterized protein YjbJ (UPF0337 family)